MTWTMYQTEPGLDRADAAGRLQSLLDELDEEGLRPVAILCHPDSLVPNTVTRLPEPGEPRPHGPSVYFARNEEVRDDEDSGLQSEANPLGLPLLQWEHPVSMQPPLFDSLLDSTERR